MKTLSYTLCTVLAAGFAFTGDAQVKPKSKKVTELKYSGRIQAQWDGIESDGTTKEDRNHFYFRRLFLGGHAKMGDNWGGDVVMDFAASPNSDSTVFIDGASVWYNTDSIRIDVGQKKVPFGVEETTSSSKLKAIERSAVNRQFAERLKFNARHTGIFAKGDLGDSGFKYDLAVVNSGQNHNSKDSGLKSGLYQYDGNELSYYGRLAYANYDSDIRYSYGAAAGVMECDEEVSTTTESGVTSLDYNPADKITAYNIFGSIGFGAFNFEAEYMTGKVSGIPNNAVDDITDGTDDTHKGYSLQASYALSNAPHGSWELLYRYSEVEGSGNSDEELISAKEIIRRANIVNSSVDRMEQHYVGVNYLFNGHDAKFMLGYEMNELDEDGIKADADGFRARVQFLF